MHYINALIVFILHSIYPVFITGRMPQLINVWAFYITMFGDS